MFAISMHYIFVDPASIKYEMLSLLYVSVSKINLEDTRINKLRNIIRLAYMSRVF